MTLRNCQSAFSSTHIGSRTNDLRHDGAGSHGFASNMFGGTVVISSSSPILRHLVILSSYAHYGGAITMIGANSAGSKPLLSHVSIVGANVPGEGGAVFHDTICFDWVGGNITGCTSGVGGSAIRSYGNKCDDSNTLIQDLIVEGNANTHVHYGSGAFWLRSASSPIIIRNVVFRNNVDSRARDIYITEVRSSKKVIHLINNHHTASKSSTPPVIQLLRSCDEVNYGWRGVPFGKDRANTYLLESLRSDDRAVSVETRCSFVPKGGLKNMHTVVNNPLHLKVDGWNVIARREWQDNIDFNLNWNDYKNGFGNLNTGFWFGNQIVSQWTDSRDYNLLVHFCKCDIFLTFNYTYSYLSLQMNALVFD